VEPGQLVSGKYRLLQLLGAGGMGSVWGARNELTDRDFAIKFLAPDLAQNKEALQRFFHEAKACGQIKHPAVVDVYDMGQAEDGTPYLVMELLEGEGFDQRLARAGVIRPPEAAAWIAFVARGLDEAHQRGLVHRDLKPGNIFFAIDARGDVVPKVLDFGVSKATNAAEGDFARTQTGAVLGSPAYMSPEQAQGETDVDGRSDVWALGVILYEALTGRVPFDAPNYNALMVAIMAKPHIPVRELNPAVPPELSAVVDGALQKDRANRIASAKELADRLEGVVMKITASPLTSFQPKMTTLPPPRLSMASVPSIPLPALLPKNLSTSQGPWSEEQRSRSTQRPASPAMMLGAGLLLAVAVLGAAAAGIVRLRPPIVAVAAREQASVTIHLERIRGELDRVKAEAAIEEKAKAAAEDKTLVVEPSELPSVKKKLPLKPGANPNGGATKPAKNDPHGGVDSAGF
jgi:serine/threonine-protein kinase